MTRARYDIYLNTPECPVVHAADLVVEEEGGVFRQAGFRYQAAYLDSSLSFPLDPVHLPLNSGELHLGSQDGIPSIVDDYLPDAWGRQTLTTMHG